MNPADLDDADQFPQPAMEWTSPPDECGYLPREVWSLTYRVYPTLPPADYEHLLERGWRRHGIHFFRPACARCRQCRSLRVIVAQFRLSKSQRRVWRRQSDIRVSLGRPDVSRQHIELFNRYHEDMHRRRGWPLRYTSAQEYADGFLVGDFEFAHELRFWRQEQLLGVSLIDLTPRCGSSVYFYHDPAWRPARPGVYSILTELSIAGRIGIEHHYLGYWIADCVSMAYKSQYAPHELLRAYVADDQRPCWEAPQSETQHLGRR